jgi:hypothetical protein
MGTTYLKLFRGLAEIPNFDDPGLRQYGIDPEYLAKVAGRIAFSFDISDDDMFNIIQNFNEMCLSKRLRNINHSYCVWGIVQGCKTFLRDSRGPGGEPGFEFQDKEFEGEFEWIEKLLDEVDY